jgi:hypothetical protein
MLSPPKLGPKIRNEKLDIRLQVVMATGRRNFNTKALNIRIICHSYEKRLLTQPCW